MAALMCVCLRMFLFFFFFFKQKTAYEIRISDCSSDVCSSDLADRRLAAEMRDRIEIVHGAGITMRALVDDILDVAKIETGNMTKIGRASCREKVCKYV